MKKIALLSLTTLFALNTLSAQQSGNYNKRKKGNYNYNSPSHKKLSNKTVDAYFAKDNSTVLEVKAISNQKADAYIAIFNLTQMGKTTKETNQLMNDRCSGFINELGDLGIAEEHIHLDMVSFIPQYEYEVEKRIFGKTYNEVPKGFEMQKNVHIRYTDPKLLDKIITKATSFEIYDLIKVDYIINQPNVVFEELRKQCRNQLMVESKNYVEQLGINLDSGRRIIAEDKEVIYPLSRYESYQAFSNVSLGTVGSGKSKTVQAYKPETSFYHGISYEDFDIVINADMVAPCVQFVLSMKMRVLPKEKEYIWMSPDGDLVPVKID